MSEFIAEIIGTFILILLGNGVVANVTLKDTYGNNGGLIAITTGWGLAVFVAVFMVGDYSGAHINPAVTIGLASAGLFAWSKVPMFILAQMIGAMVGSMTVYHFYKNHYDQTEDGDTKRASFCTSPAIRNKGRNLFSEVIGTFVLILGVLLISGPTVEGENLEGVKVGLGAIGSLPVGFLVFVIGLSLGGTTGYAINPARDLGPRIIHALVPMRNKGSNDWNYSWVPILGPIVGCLIAAGLYLLLGL